MKTETKHPKVEGTEEDAVPAEKKGRKLKVQRLSVRTAVKAGPIETPSGRED